MMRRIWLSAAVAGLLFSGLAWASETEGEVNLFAGDVGNAVWTLVIFILVIVVLGKYAWGPLLNALQQREQFIRDSLQEAKDDREAAKALLQEYEARVQKATELKLLRLQPLLFQVINLQDTGHTEEILVTEPSLLLILAELMQQNRAPEALRGRFDLTASA